MRAWCEPDKENVREKLEICRVPLGQLLGSVVVENQVEAMRFVESIRPKARLQPLLLHRPTDEVLRGGGEEVEDPLQPRLHVSVQQEDLGCSAPGAR